MHRRPPSLYSDAGHRCRRLEARPRRRPALVVHARAVEAPDIDPAPKTSAVSGAARCAMLPRRRRMISRTRIGPRRSPSSPCPSPPLPAAGARHVLCPAHTLPSPSTRAAPPTSIPAVVRKGAPHYVFLPGAVSPPIPVPGPALEARPAEEAEADPRMKRTWQAHAHRRLSLQPNSTPTHKTYQPYRTCMRPHPPLRDRTGARRALQAAHVCAMRAAYHDARAARSRLTRCSLTKTKTNTTKTMTGTMALAEDAAAPLRAPSPHEPEQAQEQEAWRTAADTAEGGGASREFRRAEDENVEQGAGARDVDVDVDPDGEALRAHVASVLAARRADSGSFSRFRARAESRFRACAVG
ncbi:hypothetical protein FB451DRAFT_1406150 [Mycena latifolia]|nr:hypothetical protein FB451DRAFT_1406150 [Mycena latifolia]